MNKCDDAKCGKRIKSGKQKVMCMAECGRSYRAKSVNLTDYDINLLNTNKYILFMCERCSSYLLKMVKELMEFGGGAVDKVKNTSQEHKSEVKCIGYLESDKNKGISLTASTPAAGCSKILAKTANQTRGGGAVVVSPSEAVMEFDAVNTKNEYNSHESDDKNTSQSTNSSTAGCSKTLTANSKVKGKKGGRGLLLLTSGSVSLHKGSAKQPSATASGGGAVVKVKNKNTSQEHKSEVKCISYSTIAKKGNSLTASTPEAAAGCSKTLRKTVNQTQAGGAPTAAAGCSKTLTKTANRTQGGGAEAELVSPSEKKPWGDTEEDLDNFIDNILEEMDSYEEGCDEWMEKAELFSKAFEEYMEKYHIDMDSLLFSSDVERSYNNSSMNYYSPLNIRFHRKKRKSKKYKDWERI